MSELIHGDALEELEKLEEDSVDLVLTDPPFNISEGASDIKVEGREDFHMDYGEWDKGATFPPSWVPLCAETLKPSGSFVSFYDNKNMEVMKAACTEAGFETQWRLYWIKSNPITRFRVQTHRNGVEELWAGAFSNDFWYNSDMSQPKNWFEAPNVSGGESMPHPTQKPVAFMEWIIKYLCPPEGTVLDPFLGSGTTAVAAEQAGRDWIGIELDEDYVDMAKERLRTETHREGSDAMGADW